MSCLDGGSGATRRGGTLLARPPGVHGVDVVDVLGVEQGDRVLAAIFGEVAVVAVDHCQAGAHVAGKVDGGDAGTKRERGERVARS